MDPPVEQKDPRIEWLANYTCKTLRLKEDKWSRMMVSDEQRTYLNRFLEDRWPQASLFLFLIKYTEMYLHRNMIIHRYLKSDLVMCRLPEAI